MSLLSFTPKVCPSIRILIGAAALGWIFVATPAAGAAPTKDECIDADTAAQTLRRERKLREARQDLLICSAESCPSAVRQDCVERLEEVDRAMPTLVLEAKSAAGEDLTEVKVTIDGVPVQSTLAGSAVEIDPGEHEITLEAPGEAPVTRRFVIREGEKARRERVVFGNERAVATLTIAAGEGDEIYVDGTQVGLGRWSASTAVGMHDLKVTHPGKKPYRVTVDLPPNGVRSLDVTLEPEARGLPTWFWITAGVVATGGLAIGGYFLFRGPTEEPGSRPIGKMASVTLSFGLGGLR